MGKKIYLSDTNKKIGGVCGGLGEYLGIDPTLIRLLVVIISFMTAIMGGVIAYIVAWAIIPQHPKF
ncbi:phage shock protein C (PspC) family protein [Anaerobacterium chartisolvens]|uniref:Phage shock protein C (PspC) family protein n=1 Tax=Anaerobacterium chartisolvens TaxID=1297424 RepID=A0A369BEN1_9FIRM|nr:PspC domain-containing protein [Anaerobacterium chartisolvens]RCX19989.1 phage shock protein C (PspC) family protein [Anaerobacterium chartisolvens]